MARQTRGVVTGRRDCEVLHKVCVKPIWPDRRLAVDCARVIRECRLRHAPCDGFLHRASAACLAARWSSRFDMPASRASAARRASACRCNVVSARLRARPPFLARSIRIAFGTRVRPFVVLVMAPIVQKAAHLTKYKHAGIIKK